MGRLRDRRRGGGPSRTISGLTRTGTNSKVMGNKGGVQYPIVGEVDGGKLITVEVDGGTGDDPVITPLPARTTGVFLAEVDPYSGGAVPETDASHPPRVAFTQRGGNLLVWTANQTARLTFWVF